MPAIKKRIVPRFADNRGLPAPIVRALCRNSYSWGPRKADISITRLISAPRQHQLLKRHDHEITEDVSERLWSLMGSAVHKVCELAEGESEIAEQILYFECLGWVIKGQADIYETHEQELVGWQDGVIPIFKPKSGGVEGIITDIKNCSVYAFLLGEKPEWEAQLNVNAHFYRAHGYPVNKLQIMAFLRDWSMTKALSDQSYPQFNTQMVDIPIWSPEKTQKYIEERVTLHQAAVKTLDDDLPFCSEVEMWQRENKWAVKGNGDKRATALCDTEADAQIKLNECKAKYPKKEYIIEYRPGERIKCERGYCKAAPFCNQFHQYKLTK